MFCAHVRELAAVRVHGDDSVQRDVLAATPPTGSPDIDEIFVALSALTGAGAASTFEGPRSG
jgi:hypothetical protein